MPSVAATYGQRPITEAQLRRLFAIAYGTREEVGALGGNKRDKANQLAEIIARWGYDWDAVDQNTDPALWLRQADYDEVIAELKAIRGY